MCIFTIYLPIILYVKLYLGNEALADKQLLSEYSLFGVVSCPRWPFSGSGTQYPSLPGPLRAPVKPDPDPSLDHALSELSGQFQSLFTPGWATPPAPKEEWMSRTGPSKRDIVPVEVQRRNLIAHLIALEENDANGDAGAGVFALPCHATTHMVAQGPWSGWSARCATRRPCASAHWRGRCAATVRPAGLPTRLLRRTSSHGCTWPVPAARSGTRAATLAVDAHTPPRSRGLPSVFTRLRLIGLVSPRPSHCEGKEHWPWERVQSPHTRATVYSHCKRCGWYICKGGCSMQQLVRG